MKKTIYSLSKALVAAFLLFTTVNVMAQTPYVNILQPTAGGIEISIGSTYVISWEDNFVSTVDIDYSTDGGSNWASIITGVTGTTYNWNTTGRTAGTLYKIRIKSSVSASYYDVSTSNFSLVDAASGFISMIQPTTGETVLNNVPYLISWNDNLPSVAVKLYKGGVLTQTIATGTTGTTLQWTPSVGVAGSDYWIEVSSFGGTTGPASSGYFTITASSGTFVDVIQPDGGENWEIGSQHLISWLDDLVDAVDIQLWYGGAQVGTIATGVSGSTYLWTIPAFTAQAGYTIKVVATGGSGLVGESAAAFTISEYTGSFIDVLSPDGGENWGVGTTHLISWLDDYNTAVDLYLYNGTTYTQIGNAVGGSTMYWTLTGVPTGTTYQVVVVPDGEATTFTGRGISAANFQVSTSQGTFVDVLQPDGGENWASSSTQLISWIDDLNVSVDIDLYEGTPGSGSYAWEIANGVTGSTYLWTIPDYLTLAPQTDYYAVIYATGGGVTGYSATNFTIASSSGTFITVVQPNGGEVWQMSSTHIISWYDDINEAVEIRLTNASLATDQLIATGVVGSTYTWTIPNNGSITADANYKVKISSLGTGSTIFDESDAIFEITPFVMMSVYPNPANNNTTLNMGNAPAGNYVVQLFNRFNSLVMETTVNPEHAEELTISTQDLPNGVYFLSVTSNDTRISKKVIVQHK